MLVRALFAVTCCLWLLVCAGPARAQFVTKSGRQFMYQGNPISFNGSTFYPSVIGGTAAWHTTTFPSYIDQMITLCTNGGQNILRPTDYWNSSTAGQVMNDPLVWSNMDYLVSRCKANGMFVLMDISAYRWLLTANGLDPFTATNWYSFLDFVSNRYKNETGIAFWSIVGEPASPTSQSGADALVSFYDSVTTYLRSKDTNHLICAGGFNHMEDAPSLQWWQRIYSLTNNDVCGYKTYSQNDLNYTTTIVNYCLSINKIMVNEEFGMPQYMGDGTWSGSNYNSITTSRATLFSNVFTKGLAGGAAGFQFWNLGEQVASSSYNVAPDNTPAVWSVLQQFSPPPQPPLNLTATVAGSNEIDLSWSKNAETTVTGYNIYRSTNSGSALALSNRIANGVTAISYADTNGPFAGTTYFYRVTSVNHLNHESAGSAQAASSTNVITPTFPPLAYEPFNYAIGDLVGQTGSGGGWMDASWSNPSPVPWKSGAVLNRGNDPVVVTPGLSYSNLLTSALAISNNTAQSIVTNNSYSAIRAWDLNGSGLFASPGNSLWISFLIYLVGTANNMDIGPLVNTNQTDYTRVAGALIQYNTGSAVWQVSPRIQNGANGNTYNATPTLNLQSGQPSLIVGRFTYNGGSPASLVDSIRLWVNPSPGATPLDTDPNSVSANGSLDGGGWWLIRAASTFLGIVDELRIGTNYLAVAPVPGPNSAVSLGWQYSSNNLQLLWSQGTLLEATNLAGPWITNPAPSPLTVDPTNAANFYRLRLQ